MPSIAGRCIVCSKAFESFTLLFDHQQTEYQDYCCETFFYLTEPWEKHKALPTHELRNNVVLAKSIEVFPAQKVPTGLPNPPSTPSYTTSPTTNDTTASKEAISHSTTPDPLCSSELTAATSTPLDEQTRCQKDVPFVCRLCSTAFKSRASFRNHRSQENHFFCCGRRFKNENGLMCHERDHRVFCQTCGAGFLLDCFLGLHRSSRTSPVKAKLRPVHALKQEVVIDAPKQATVTQDRTSPYLTLQILINQSSKDVTGRGVVCAYCGKQFKHTDNIIGHVRTCAQSSSQTQNNPGKLKLVPETEVWRASRP